MRDHASLIEIKPNYKIIFKLDILIFLGFLTYVISFFDGYEIVRISILNIIRNLIIVYTYLGVLK